MGWNISRKQIYFILIISYIFTAILFYQVYQLIDPFFRIIPDEASNAAGAAHPTLLHLWVITAYEFITSRPIIIYFLLLFTVLIFLNEIPYTILASIHRYLERKRVIQTNKWNRIPLVSIIVPAHNEEKVIESTVKTLLEANYSKKEIIIIDDGSTDGTVDKVRPYSNLGLISIISRPKGGKALALNTGISYSNGEIVIVIDADSIVPRDAVTRIISCFQDSDVVAASGNVKVGNRKNLITKLQSLEYIREINLRRRAFDLLNTIYVVPGAIGAFRKKIFSRVGFYDKDTVTEDMDLTLKFLKTKGKILFDSSAISFTEAPENLKGWVQQRRRWYGGTLQTILKHRTAWWRHGTLSSIGFPYLLLSIIFSPILELTFLMVGVIYLLLGFWVGIILAFFLMIGFESIATIIGILLDGEDRKLILYIPLYVLFYRYLIGIIRIRSIWDLYRKRLSWDRGQRYGNLTEKVKI
ncbi:MAG: glycosyltransferase family 2 protein [Candidatus Kariarchaeaceae archaeon]